ncbi:hypothetical protein Ancab_030517 [Ancistrocladus abbreviatus]
MTKCNNPKTSLINKSKRTSKEKSKSLDKLVTGISRRSNGELGHRGSLGGSRSSGFLGFDLDGGERRGHPLARPSGSRLDHAIAARCLLVSVLSVSSSGSSDEPPNTVPAVFGPRVEATPVCNFSIYM